MEASLLHHALNLCADAGSFLPNVCSIRERQPDDAAALSRQSLL
jgi:hypothetical protein